uniref:HXXXD-type acyl-transferase family protein n=2 Tax=Chenopodium quinoa TaxID=63459 RepID=A0A803LTY8_CHEQI
MNSSTINHISEFFVKPKYVVEESKHEPCHPAPIDLIMLSFHHIQVGLMFTKSSHLNDQEFSIHSFLEGLKDSLSLTLVHFYPLAGQLVTEVDEEKHECRVYVDCNKGPGARFIHAALGVTVSDILSPKDVPLVVKSFFNLNEEVVNYDGHTKPLLCVQVTELLDGVFIACSINHCITDGTSYWHFWNKWSEIHRANNNQNNQIYESHCLPIHKRWFPNGCDPPIPLPFTHCDEFIRKFEPSQLRDRIFHFSSESITRLKAIANKESNAENISSFQALCALVWRSIIRASRLLNDQVIYSDIIANTRHRLDPPLPEFYFGNSIKEVTTSTTTSDLLENNLGWVASLLHHSVASLNDRFVRDSINEWLQSPFCLHHAELYDYNKVTIEQSPRFDMYGNEFGLGKAVAIRSGYANKAMGVIYAYPGHEGGRAVDLEICLPPDSMNTLELDEEFMACVSLPE